MNQCKWCLNSNFHLMFGNKYQDMQVLILFYFFKYFVETNMISRTNFWQKTRKIWIFKNNLRAVMTK